MPENDTMTRHQDAVARLLAWAIIVTLCALLCGGLHMACRGAGVVAERMAWQENALREYLPAR